MSSQNNKTQNNAIIILLSAFLLIYVSIRAYTLSFTHDESLSFSILHGNEIMAKTANNHHFNTLLMSICETLFGTSEFSLRLPNVLGFVLYAVACFFILRNSKKIWITLFGLILILLNPFLLEFFSLARGYGLSLAFLLMAIYFLVRNEKYESTSTFLKDFILTALCAALAMYANLAMINFYISILIIFAFKYWLFKKSQHLTSNFTIKFLSIILISCIALALGMMRILKLEAAGELYFGVPNFIDGMDSLVVSSIYFQEYFEWAKLILKIVVALLLSVGVLYLIIKKKFEGALFMVTMLIALLITGLYLERNLFAAKYPTARTALYYIPITAVFIYYMFLELINQYHIKKLYYVPLVACLITPLLINFVSAANFSYVKEWKYDAHTKDAMKTIRRLTQKADSNVSISNTWLFEPAINYYITTWKLNVNPANRDGINQNSDFIYRLDDTARLDGYKVLNSYNDINSELLMKSPTK